MKKTKRLIFKSTLESLVEGIKVFLGKDLNTDDVVILDGRPARVVRVGMWKTIFFVYEVGTANGEPYVKGGNKVAIQNDQLKVHIIEKPLPMLDLSKWEKKHNSSESKRKKTRTEYGHYLDDQFFLDKMTDSEKKYTSEHDKKVFVTRRKISHMLREMGYSPDRLTHLRRTLWTKKDERDIVTR